MTYMELLALTKTEIAVITRFREQVAEVTKVLDQMQTNDIVSILYNEAGVYSHLVANAIIEQGHKTKNNYLVSAGKDVANELLQ